MRTLFLTAIASASLMTSAACKQTKTEGEQTQVDKANEDLAAARTKYIAAAKERLAMIDAKIDELGKRADAASSEAAEKLRARRDQLATKLDAMGKQAASGWASFKQDVERGVDSIEKDIDNALK
jgi:septal ring factor EnvC (AmiA/AmiB activator)